VRLARLFCPLALDGIISRSPTRSRIWAPGELRHARDGQRQRLDEQTEFGALFAGRADKESDRRLGQNDVARRRSFGQGSQANYPRARAQPLIATCRQVKALRAALAEKERARYQPGPV
jgi:hypothetical protein